MIPVKNERELVIMRKACKITAAARALAGEMVRPGVTTKQIDKAVYEFILSQGAKPTFLGYGGFPASTCISVNEVIIHGIPGNRVLKEGDIVSVQKKTFVTPKSDSKREFLRPIMYWKLRLPGYKPSQKK